MSQNGGNGLHISLEKKHEDMMLEASQGLLKQAIMKDPSLARNTQHLLNIPNSRKNIPLWSPIVPENQNTK